MSTDFPYGRNDRGNAATSLGLDDWLHHSTGGFDDEGLVLAWKKNKDDSTGELLAWLHTQAPILAVYRHTWFKVKEIEDKETGKKRVEVYSDRFVCHEKEALLKARKWRFSSRQDRNYPPPQDCPFDRVLELIFTEVQSGHLSWVEPVFEFKGSEGGDRKTTDVLLHAAGLYGGYGEKNMPPGKVAELRRANIRRDEAWSEDVRAKVAYILTVVDNEHPENGPRLLLEGEAFKRSFTKAINDERKRMRRNDDSPVGPNARPYPFLFTYDKTQDFSDRYSATAMSDSPAPTIQALINDLKNIPDTKEFTTPGDSEALLASIEEHALVKLDFASCFHDGKARAQVPANAPGSKAAPTGAKSAPAAVEHLFSCEHCGKATMKETDFECPVCHAVYVEAKDDADNPVVVLSHRPCTKCGTLIELPEVSPSENGQVGENVICSKCGTIHHEVRVQRALRPCENPECKAEVALTPGVMCGTCGKTHEFGETDPEPAPSQVNAWVAVAPVVEEPKKAAPVRRVRR